MVVTGPSSFDYYTAKYASTNGAVLWEQRYTGTNNIFDIPSGVAVDRNNDVVVTGSTGTMKYSGTNGALLWEQHDQSGWRLALDASNNVVVTGIYGTIKYAAADGAHLWQQPTNRGLAVAIDHSGNVVIAGDSYQDHWHTAKFAGSNGTLLWEKAFNPGRAVAVAIDSSDNVVVTGTVGDPYSFAADLYTVKYSSEDGAVLWNRQYDGPAHRTDAGHAVAVDESGNVLIAGMSRNANDSLSFYTAKYLAVNGALLWEKRFTNSNTTPYPPSGPCTNCIAAGPNGMVVVAGFLPSASFVDFMTIVYRETLPSVSVEAVSSGTRLRFPGSAGHSYNIERALSLSGPWSTNATLTATTNGPLEYIDTNAPPGSAFYRTSAGP